MKASIFESIQVIIHLQIESIQKKEAIMHPINFLFDEINRDYWGIPGRKIWSRREREIAEVKEARAARR
jgi:hypothetical protein